MAQPRRDIALDALRGFATLVVLAVHAPASAAGDWGYALLHEVQRSGAAAVDLFFALSGYLIVGLLLAERQDVGTINVKAFAVRRIAKIYPTYLVFLAGVALWTFNQTPGSIADRLTAIVPFWPALAHLQNYIAVPAAPHLWSLAAEEHFYAMLLCLVLIAGRTRGPLDSRLIPKALLAIVALSWLYRCAYVLWWYQGVGQIGFTYTHNRLDAVVAGAFVAWLVQRHQLDIPPNADRWRRWRPALLCASVVCTIPTLIVDPYANRSLALVGILPLQALGFGCLFLALAVPLGARQRRAAPDDQQPRNASLPLRLIAFVGISSYSTYLWHMPFATVLTSLATGSVLDHHPARSLLLVSTFILISLAMGVVSWLLIERPALAWGRRVSRRRFTRSVPVPARSSSASQHQLQP